MKTEQGDRCVGARFIFVKPVLRSRASSDPSGVSVVRIGSARAEGGVSRTSEFAARLERAGLRNDAFAAKKPAALSDGAAWTRNVCEEIFPGHKVTCVLDQFHTLDCDAAAVQSLALDKGERQAWMERI